MLVLGVILSTALSAFVLGTYFGMWLERTQGNKSNNKPINSTVFTCTRCGLPIGTETHVGDGGPSGSKEGNQFAHAECLERGLPKKIQYPDWLPTNRSVDTGS